MATRKELNHIKQLKPLARNPRRHNPRNIGMLVDSLQEVGAARSIVIDENNEVLAGNGTLDAAAEAGITKLQVIEADGETIIAVKRKGLTPQQKARLAILDNRINETSDWDAEVLASLADEGIELDDLWSEEELSELLSEKVNIEAPQNFPEVDESIETQHECPKCGYRWSGKSNAEA